MARARRSDAKEEALRRAGVLHPRAAAVTDEAFLSDPFFDARDLVQVKYEMLRRVASEDRSVAASAESFGLSRPTFYEAQRAFVRDGLPGLLPRKRGPRGGHKLTDEVLAFVLAERAGDDRPAAHQLVRRVHERFGVQVHVRTVERALARRGKAGR
jgi:transposase